MENKAYFGRYPLSQASLDKLQEIEALLEDVVCPPNPYWALIRPKLQETEKARTEDEKPLNQPDVLENLENLEDCRMESTPSASTQFFFSQKETSVDSARLVVAPIVSKPRWSDVAELLYESLENRNDTQALSYLKDLSETEIGHVVRSLGDKLSFKGTYNLCHSICAINTDDSIVYIKILCKHLLLQKIIDLEGPSRQMSLTIQELLDAFPEDIQEFVYIPMLNAELKDTTVISAMINGFDPQTRNDSTATFLTSVDHLKEWHLLILSQLFKSKLTDDSMKDKLLNLLLEKATTYSRDKNYGKFIVSFLKLNSPFTEGQKSSINEIVAVNETIFTRVMDNLLRNMYIYNALWHVS